MAAFLSQRAKMMTITAAGVGAAITAWTLQTERQHARNWHSNVHLRYPPSANYPDLSNHNNHMSDQLTPAVGCIVLTVFKLTPLLYHNSNATFQCVLILDMKHIIIT